jgi:hypothetical protein
MTNAHDRSPMLQIIAHKSFLLITIPIIIIVISFNFGNHIDDIKMEL